MGEMEFVEFLYKKLKKKFKDYTLSKYESLIYKVTVDKDGSNALSYFPVIPENPKRGSYAFQTDLLVKKDNLPLVVIEAKWNNITSHDVLTYSTKALKHKEVYPYLRYGLIIGGGIKFLPRRFFIHNQGFDFAFAMNDTNNYTQIESFFKVIEEQIECSLYNLEILQNKVKPKAYNAVSKYIKN